MPRVVIWALPPLGVHRRAKDDDSRGGLGLGMLWQLDGTSGRCVGDHWGVVSARELVCRCEVFYICLGAGRAISRSFIFSNGLFLFC